MTNDFLTALTDVAVLLLLLLIASFITRAILFVSEAIRRPFLRTRHFSSSPNWAALWIMRLTGLVTFDRRGLAVTDIGVRSTGE